MYIHIYLVDEQKNKKKKKKKEKKEIGQSQNSEFLSLDQNSWETKDIKW